MASDAQYLVTVSLDPPFGNLGVWDTRKGGDPKSKAITHRAGGMGQMKTYFGLPTYDNVTVSRVVEEDRGDFALLGQLIAYVGKVMGQVSEQPLDDNGNPYGTPRTWYGRLGDVKGGDVDSEGTKVRMLEVDIEVETITG